MVQQAKEIHIADNDFLIKLARWNLLDDFLDVVNTNTRHVRVITSLRVRTGLLKGRPNLSLLGNVAAAARLDNFLINTGPPTPIDYDFMAAAANIQHLDQGEVVLLAGLCKGAGHYFYTGDKRAIAALSAFAGTAFDEKLRGRIICLEQVIYRIIDTKGIGTVRANIAADFDADAGIANKFVGGAQTPQATIMTSLALECAQIRNTSNDLLSHYPL